MRSSRLADSARTGAVATVIRVPPDSQPKFILGKLVTLGESWTQKARPVNALRGDCTEFVQQPPASNMRRLLDELAGPRMASRKSGSAEAGQNPHQIGGARDNLLEVAIGREVRGFRTKLG